MSGCQQVVTVVELTPPAFIGATAPCRSANTTHTEEELTAPTEALMKQATCRVYAGGRFAGTGSLLGRDDIVITAAHLFEGRQVSGLLSPTNSAPIEVLFMPPDDSPNAAKPFPDIFKGISRTPAALILLNEKIDLAILRITPTNRTPVRLADSCAVGQKIMAPSYKHGKELIFPLAGIVDITDDGIIYNASAGSGSSGAPIVNLKGELVGICRGAVEGGLKIMAANHKTIRQWFNEINQTIGGIIER